MTGVLLRRSFRQHAALLAAILMGLLAIEVALIWIGAQIEAGPGLQFLISLLPRVILDSVQTQLGMVSFPGMVGFGFQHPAVLMAAAAFMVVVGTIPAGERESGFLDLILARGVTRGRYLLSVLLLLLAGAVILPMALLLGTAVGLALVQAPEEIPWTRYAPSAAGMTTLLLALGGLSTVLAAAARRREEAVTRSAGAFLLLYVLDFLATIWAPLRPTRWINPFHYYDPIAAALTPGASPENPIVLLAVFAGAAGLALLIFRRRDL